MPGDEPSAGKGKNEMKGESRHVRRVFTAAEADADRTAGGERQRE